LAIGSRQKKGKRRGTDKACPELAEGMPRYLSHELTRMGTKQENNRRGHYRKWQLAVGSRQEAKNEGCGAKGVLLRQLEAFSVDSEFAGQYLCTMIRM